jgi:hypothetical protein
VKNLFQSLPFKCNLQRYTVGPDVFHTLRTATGAGFECFASPLNTFFGRFCGAFPDVDAPFGSSGDFFALPAAALKRGCFQVGLSLAGVRLVTWNILAVIEWRLLSYALLGLSLPGVRLVTWSILYTGCHQLNRVFTAR